MDRAADHLVDYQDDQAIVQQQHIGRFQVTRQFLVIETNLFLIADVARRIQREFLAGFELNLSVLEFADTDLRALQIRHDRHFATASGGGFAYHFCTVDMVLRLAM